MKYLFVFFVLSLTPFALIGQSGLYPFDSNPDQLYGHPNHDAAEQIMDWADLIGESECKSLSRNPDATWADTVSMIWRFKYIMNGLAIQDETLKEDGKHAGSIHQYNADSAVWYVHHYSSANPTPVLSAREGNKNDDGNIILYKE